MIENTRSKIGRQLLGGVLSLPGLTVLAFWAPANGQDGASRAPVALFRELPGAIDAVHDNGATGRLLLPEITGGGAALFDLDRDGDLDLYLVQGGQLGPGAVTGDVGRGDQLFRNLRSERGELQFVDVSGEVGDLSRGYGMGVAAADFDNDGWIDLYVANLGPNSCLRNERGRLREISCEPAGSEGWSIGAAPFDFDRDGDLDLFVVQYVAWTPQSAVTCYATSTRRDYCGPAAYPATADRLLRNRGDGTFELVAEDLLGERPGPGLGVTSFDADGDGWPDLAVANDGAPNRLWLNRSGRTLEEQGLLSGLATNRQGIAEASMGIAIADANGDGREDLLMTHLSGETNTFYSGRGDGLFEDRTIEVGLSAPSRRYTAFGTAWIDVENDGRLDLLVANGAVRLEEGLEPGGLGQPNQLYRQARDGSWREASEQMPDSFRALETSRGLVVGDLDDDGDEDFVVVNSGGPVRVYQNLVGANAAVLSLSLLAESGRDALGAKAWLRIGESDQVLRVARSDGSYASARDPRVQFGLGAGASVREVRVRWPSGADELFRLPAATRIEPRAPQWWILREGSADSWRPPGAGPAGGGRANRRRP